MNGTTRTGRLARSSVLVVALAGIAACFYYEVAFQGRTFVSGSQVEGVMGYEPPWGFEGVIPDDPVRRDHGAPSWIYAPSAHAVARAWERGRAPLWNPGQGLGVPLAAGALSGGFDWLRFPFLFARGPLAWDLYHLALTILAMQLTWWYASVIGLLPWARILAAVAFAFSGFLVLYNDNAFLEVYVMLPGLLLGVELLLAGRAGLGFASATVAVVTATLAGMPESTLMVFLYASGYGVCRLVGQARLERSWKPIGALPARLMVLSSVLGLALSAPLLLPLAEYIANAHHIHGPEHALGLDHLPAADAIRLAYPFLGDARPGSAVAQLGYSGAAVVALAALGAASARRATAAMAHLIVTAVFLAKIFGLPGVNELGRLPGLILTIIPKWGASCLAFGLAMLAAIAADAIARRRLERRSVSLAALALTAILSFLLARNLEVFTKGPALRQTMLALGLGVGAAFAALVLARAGRRWTLAGPALALLVFAELFALAPHGIYATRHDPLTAPPFVGFLSERREAMGPHRVLGLGAMLYPNTATAFGLEDFRSVDALYPSRYFEYLRRFISPHLHDRYTAVKGNESPTRLGDNPWLDAAGVRYVVIPKTTSPTSRRHGLGPFPQQFELVYKNEVDVYENKSALPRAWLTAQVHVARDREAAAARAHSTGFDPTQQAVIESAAAIATLSTGGHARTQAGSVEILEHQPERVRLVVRARSPALLVLAEQYFPGWEATVDGIPSTIYATNLAFRGVVVPEGVSEVAFSYSPASFRHGCVIAAAAALLWLMILLFLRRRSAPSEAPQRS